MLWFASYKVNLSFNKVIEIRFFKNRISKSFQGERVNRRFNKVTEIRFLKNRVSKLFQGRIKWMSERKSQ